MDTAYKYSKKLLRNFRLTHAQPLRNLLEVGLDYRPHEDTSLRIHIFTCTRCARTRSKLDLSLAGLSVIDYQWLSVVRRVWLGSGYWRPTRFQAQRADATHRSCAPTVVVPVSSPSVLNDTLWRHHGRNDAEEMVHSKNKWYSSVLRLSVLSYPGFVCIYLNFTPFIKYNFWNLMTLMTEKYTGNNQYEIACPWWTPSSHHLTAWTGSSRPLISRHRKWMYGWVDEWMGAKMDGWMRGQIGGWIGGRILNG